MTREFLICTAGFGEGHNTAARAVLCALEERGACARLVDLCAEVYPETYRLARAGYLALINRSPKLWSAVYRWIDRQPKVGRSAARILRLEDAFIAELGRCESPFLISTYPLYGYLRAGLPEDAPRPPLLTVVTDSISVNSIWWRSPSDAFLVANDETASAMKGAGVPAERVRVTGFPVAPRFADFDLARLRPPRRNPAEILYIINSGKRGAAEVVRALCAMPEVRLTVTVGRDDDLRREVEALCAGAVHPARVLGWTDQVPELLARSDVAITKAGGATVQEAMAARCPLILSQVVPGQEEGNAELITRNRCGAVAEGAGPILAAVREALADGGRLLADWQARIARISRPAAARDIARIAIEWPQTQTGEPR